MAWTVRCWLANYSTLVEGESVDCEAEEDAEGGHRQIDVEPARDRVCASAQDHGPWVFGGGGAWRGSVDGGNGHYGGTLVARLSVLEVCRADFGVSGQWELFGCSAEIDVLADELIGAVFAGGFDIDCVGANGDSIVSFIGSTSFPSLTFSTV